MAFDTPSSIVVTGTSFFFKEDEGAKLIAPSIWNAYIDEVSEPVGAAGSFTKATLKGYTGFNWTSWYKKYSRWYTCSRCGNWSSNYNWFI